MSSASRDISHLLTDMSRLALDMTKKEVTFTLMTDYKEICLKTCEIARKAGVYIAEQRRGFSFDKVEFKGSQNLVSYVDKTAERMIVEALTELLPGAGFITEEGTAGCGAEEYKWVIDPLDGTTNFIHGLPPYCVSIGLMCGAEVVVGVVYEITLQEMFYAWQGSEAYLNGEAITVSDTDKLANSLVAIGFSYSTDTEIADFQRQIEYFHRNSNGLRRLGSAAADMVYVACGRFDAFAQVNLSPWDVCGGALIVQRAGGVVTQYNGGSDYVFGRSIIAAAPGVYDEFTEAVAVTRREA